MKTINVDEVFQAARGKWVGLLGGHLTERTARGLHGACPSCGGKDRFRLDDYQGRGDSFCGHCGYRDGLTLVMDLHNLSFTAACEWVLNNTGRVRKVTEPKQQKSTDDLKADLRRVWGGGVAVTEGDPVWLYLKHRCGIKTVPAGIRYHPELDYWHEDGSKTTHPAMLASVMDSTGRCLSVHRTYLTSTGEKAAVKTARKLMPPSDRLHNVAIRLAPVLDGWLAVAEGVETALAYSTLWGVPCWSTVSAGLLESFSPPDGVTLLTIAGDNDRSFTGQASAYKLAKRLVQERPEIEVRVHLPIGEGSDFADDFSAKCDCAPHSLSA